MVNEDFREQLQDALWSRIYAASVRPHSALSIAIRDHPNVKLLEWVFVITQIAQDVRHEHQEGDNFNYCEWLEAGASLACDAYALTALGSPNPDGTDWQRLWGGQDPHLEGDGDYWSQPGDG